MEPENIPWFQGETPTNHQLLGSMFIFRGVWKCFLENFLNIVRGNFLKIHPKITARALNCHPWPCLQKDWHMTIFWWILKASRKCRCFLCFFWGGNGVLHPNICDFGMVPPKFNIDTQNCDMFQRRCIFQTILFIGIFANFWGVFLTKSQQNWLFENMLLPTEVIFKFA